MQRRNNFYKEYDELGQILSPVTICIELHHFASSLTTFKIILPYV